MLAYLSRPPLREDAPGSDGAVCEEGGYLIREMEAGDVAACDELFQRTNGCSRKNDIAASLKNPPPIRPYVILRDGEIAGYHTGFYLLGHGVYRSEEAFRHLVSAVPGEVLVHLPIRLHPELLRWCLLDGWKTVRQEILISLGLYQEPDGIYCPGMGY